MFRSTLIALLAASSAAFAQNATTFIPNLLSTLQTNGLHSLASLIQNVSTRLSAKHCWRIYPTATRPSLLLMTRPSPANPLAISPTLIYLLPSFPTILFLALSKLMNSRNHRTIPLSIPSSIVRNLSISREIKPKFLLSPT